MTRFTSLTITAAMALAIATPAFAQVIESPTATTVVVPRARRASRRP